MAGDLLPLLEAYNNSALTHMASFHGLTKKGPRGKAETARALAATLAESKHLQATLAALSPGERAALAALQRAGGRLSVRSLRETLKQQGLLDPPRKPVRSGLLYPPVSAPDPLVKDPRLIEDIVARLQLRGLVFDAETDRSGDRAHAPAAQGPLRDFNRPVTTVFIPASIRRQLPAPPPLTTAPPEPLAVTTVTESSARAFQRDLYLYWSFVRRQPLSLTAKGEPRKAQLKEVNATLLVRAELGKGEGELDHPRLRFVRALLGALNLLETSRGGDTVHAASRADDFFALPAAERVKQCFETWCTGTFWSDLLLLLPREVRPRSGPALEAGDDGLAKARGLVLEYVASLSMGEGWAPFDQLLAQIRGTDYEFLFSRRPASPYDYSPYYSTHPYTAYGNRLNLDFPGVKSEEDGWDKVEASYIQALVTGPLHWMGLADLGWLGKAGSTPADAFRLTDLGRWVLDIGPRPEIPSEGGRVIVQPNLHIVALDPVVDATLITLDRFAERLSAERAVEYRLTRASVYAGQQAGWNVARIKDFLRQQTGAELPGNVARTLDEWQAQHERIVLYPRVALAHGRPEALDMLAAHPKAASLAGARLTPELVQLTSAKAIPGVVQALGASGILPVVTQPGALMPGSVEAGEDGTLRLLAPQPSLYLHGHLAAFADPVGDDRYEITAATVARAARSGLTAPQIVERLQAAHRGPVPAGLVRRVRAWARHYGDAALEPVTLLQLRDAATLNELLADPEVGALLQTFRPAASKALARVKPQDVAKLRALLAERGVDLEDKLS